MNQAQPHCASYGTSSTETHTFQFSPERETVVVDVVEAVAAVASVEPMQFEPRLHEAIDPDALTRCIHSGGPDVSVSFTLGAYDVTVRGGGEIVIEES
ncbi:HalOD1 output domain-containing protein [Halobellus sp. GM3]|uniref:HalOD1 output domain-containing protein n=1 Tax=Halobellus sp. GM3 TaxID=3458410 RepID=UPI00403DFEB8